MTTFPCFAKINGAKSQGKNGDCPHFFYKMGTVPFILLGIEVSGSSVAWLARLLWEQEVVGSNPISPIKT